MNTRTCLLVLLVLLPLVSSCAAMQANTQGPTQPQSTSGPCSVKPFFLLGFRSVPAQMSIANTGQACTFTLINPALNVVIDAALLTQRPDHGAATANLVGGARQVAVSYTPRPGYQGADKFSVTLEPGAVGITVHVAVTPGR